MCGELEDEVISFLFTPSYKGKFILFELFLFLDINKFTYVKNMLKVCETINVFKSIEY